MSKELKKILFVDDDEDIHFIVELSLKDIPNLEVKNATSGEEAIKIAMQFEPDLILLDVMMPKMDGLETLKAIRLLPSISKTPVVFLTARAQKNEVEAYYHYDGVIDVIIKPFNPTELPQEVLRIWDKHAK